MSINPDLVTLGELTLLTYLDISGNGYAGQIPAALCRPPLQTFIVKSLDTSPINPPNDFSCIASCLRQSFDLVLVVPAKLPLCPDLSPTMAPTTIDDASSLQNKIAPQTAMEDPRVISAIVVSCFLFFVIAILLCVALRRRRQQQKLKEGEADTWELKKQSKLDIHELRSVSTFADKSGTACSDEYSQSGIPSICWSDSQSRSSSDSSRSRRLDSRFSVRTQNSSDLSFTVVVESGDQNGRLYDDNATDVFSPSTASTAASQRSDDRSERSSGSSRYTGMSSSTRSTRTCSKMQDVRSIDISIFDDDEHNSSSDDEESREVESRRIFDDNERNTIDGEDESGFHSRPSESVGDTYTRQSEYSASRESEYSESQCSNSTISQLVDARTHQSEHSASRQSESQQSIPSSNRSGQASAAEEKSSRRSRGSASRRSVGNSHTLPNSEETPPSQQASVGIIGSWHESSPESDKYSRDSKKAGHVLAPVGSCPVIAEERDDDSLSTMSELTMGTAWESIGPAPSKK
jgi:hypothetical protein